MGLQVSRTYTCDYCGEKITNMEEMAIARVEGRLKGQGKMHTKYFCNKQHANAWWRQFIEGRDEDLIL